MSNGHCDGAAHFHWIPTRSTTLHFVAEGRPDRHEMRLDAFLWRISSPLAMQDYNPELDAADLLLERRAHELHIPTTNNADAPDVEAANRPPPVALPAPANGPPSVIPLPPPHPKQLKVCTILGCSCGS